MIDSTDDRTNRDDAERTRLRRFLIGSDVVYAVLFSLAWFPAIFSAMFASGGTDLRVYIQIYSLLTFPFVLLFAMIVPWVFYRLRMHKTAKVLVLLPMINIVLILLYVLIPSWVA